MKQLILNDFHMLPTGGHAGINRMFNNIRKYYFWNGMKKDVENFVKRCDDCQKCKYSLNKKQPMKVTTTAMTAFQKVMLDLVGPLENDEDNNRYILTLQCELSKFVECYPLPNKEAKTVAKAFVENFILRYGIPQEILTDQGTEFTASIFQEVCSLLKINSLRSTAYHHQTLGALENSHKNLGSFLRIQALNNPTQWSTWLPYWSFAYNNTVHTETKYTPFELVFGKIGILPSNLIQEIDPLYSFDNYPLELKYRLQTANADARKNLIASKVKRKQYFDKKNHCKSVSYKIGDKVLLKNCGENNKQKAIFKGPYKVIENKDSNVVIRIDSRLVEVHKDRIKFYYG